MKDFTAFLALPASLLNIVATTTVHAQELPWPYNLPRTVKYFPEHETHITRDAEVQAKLAWQAPVSVKKMSVDEGEKFFLHYWDFGEQSLDLESNTEGRTEEYSNFSMANLLLPAIAPHAEGEEPSRRLFGRSIFQRAFQCPSGTISCSSIGQDDLCCEAGDTCVSLSSGVGCCPQDETCGDAISDCTNGYTSCPNSPNGGCCVPGASCEGSGCVFYGTSTVTTTLSTATSTNGASFTTETSSGRTTTVVYPTSIVSVSTETVTMTPSGYTTTATVTLSGACKPGYFSCAASLGGGCCASGQGCATDDQCPDPTSTSAPTSTSTATAAPPILPTSVNSGTSISAATVVTSSVAGCPTGFYMCSARYIGGCCQVGRNCDTTSCPPSATATIISSGLTVVVSGTAASTVGAQGGSCANGWALCAASAAGGCCPSGYLCGTSSCTATHSGERNTAKMAPSSANVLRWAWSFLALALVAGVGMVWL